MTCACGCPRTPSEGKRFIKGHNRRGKIVPNHTEGGRKGGRKRGQQRVPAAPVQQVLKAKGWTVQALMDELHCSRVWAEDILYRHTFFRRETAKRLLAIAAGLPRSPTLAERRLALREERRLKKREERRRAG